MNSLEMNTPGGSTQKIRLRRVPTKHEMIQKNLMQVKQNAIKKQKAQMAYYSNNTQNQSPLRRQGLQTKKNGVQNRLGLKNTVIFTNKNQQRKQQQLVLTTNKNNNNQNNFRKQNHQKRFQNPQQSGNRFNIGNNSANNRTQKFIKRQSIQERLIQIRQQPKTIRNIRNQQQQVVSNGQNKIKLRRPNLLNNYKIIKRVQTNEPQQSQIQQRTLNPQLQAEIKAIQKRVQPEEDICEPVASSKIGVTGITLNDRFTKLM